MKRILFLCGLALFLSSGVAYTAIGTAIGPATVLLAQGDSVSTPEGWVKVYEAEAGRDESSGQGRQRPRDVREETIIYKVLVNDKGQYSIWPAFLENPPGWQDTGFKGTRGECLVYLEKVWEKMKRLSLNPKPTPGATPTASPTPEPTPPPDEAQKTEQKQVNEVRDKLLELQLIRQQEDKVAQDRITREVYQILERLNPKSNQSAADFKAETNSTGGIFKATFTSQLGRIIVHLPADMRAGDKISGTVVVEPSGQTDEDRRTNREMLDRYQLKIANQTLSEPWGPFTWDWLNPMPPWVKPKPKPTPSPTPGGGPGGMQPFGPKGWETSGGKLIPISQDAAQFLLLGTPSGGDERVPFTPVVNAPVPEDFILPPSAPRAPNKIEVPDTGQGGRETKIDGPLDGDLRTTRITIGGQPVIPLVEWPGGCVFISPNQNFGLSEITISDGNMEARGPYRNIGVRLDAPKTSLLKSESTTVTTEVRGLEGIQKDVPLQLESKGVINMEGGNFQNLVIHPKDVQAGGRFTTTRKITGLAAGGFGVTATVIVDRYDMCLAGFGGYLQWLSFTGEYRFRRRGGSPAGGTQTGGTQTGGTQTGGTQTGGTQTGGTQTGGTGTGEITGKGKMVMKGCIITLSHNAPDRRVFARLDACNKTGSAEVQVDPDKTKVEIKDTNTADNACGSKK